MLNAFVSFIVRSLMLLLLLSPTCALGAMKILDQRLAIGAPWNALTGSRTLYRAQLDTVRRVVSVEKYESDTSSALLRLEWRREYPVHNLEQALIAKQAMEAEDLHWPIENFIHLHKRDCSVLFFDVPTAQLESFAGQMMRIVDVLEAQNEDADIKKLIKINAQCGLPDFHLAMVMTADSLVKRFAVVSQDGRPMQMHVRQEQGQLLIKHQNLTVVRITPSTQFDVRHGGPFMISVLNNCESGTYTDYEFELQPKWQDGKKRWELRAFRELDGKISLTSDRDPEIDVGMVIVNAPVDLVEGVLDGIFGTLIWNIFISSEGKKGLIENSIYEEAKKNESLREVFTDQELKRMAKDIAASSSLPWFAPFTGTDAIKKRASMIFAYELVRKSVLDKLPAGSLPDMANGVALHVTRDLEKCLNRANSGKNIDVCVAKFARSAPYRVGRELLELHMRDGLRGQGLNDSELRGVLNVAKTKYDQCSQQNYFKLYDDHIKKLAQERRGKKKKKKHHHKGIIDDELPFDSDAVVMSCLFEGVLEASVAATGIGVDKTIAETEMPEDKKRQAREGVLNSLQDCYVQQGFMNRAENFRRYQHQAMQKLTVESFQQGFTQCVGRAKTIAGAGILSGQVMHNPALVEATQGRPEVRQQVLDITLTRAYRPCLEKQGAAADPARCRTMLENVATEESFAVILEHQLRQEYPDNPDGLNFALRDVGLGTMEPRPYSYNLRQCFRTRLEELFTLLQEGSVLPTDDFSNANCVTRAVLELAPTLVRHRYLETLKSKPDLKDIRALRDPALINRMGSQMRACLLMELRGQNTVQGVSALLEGAQQRCTVALYKTVLPEVIEMVLESKLASVVPNPERRAELIARLKNAFAQRLSPLDTEEAIMAELDRFSQDAAVDVVKQSLAWSVEDNIPERADLRQEVSEQLIADLITPAWELEFRNAIAANDTRKQQSMQEQLKKAAGPKVMERALPLRLAQHVPNAGTRTVIVKGVVKEYRKCLDRIKANVAGFDKKFDQCAVSATNHATHAVFDASLSAGLLEYFPLRGTPAQIAGNRAAQQQIKSRLLGKSFWREVAAANASGPAAVVRLGDKVKVRAAREVADILIERELLQALGADFSQVASQVKTRAHACFNAIEERIDRRERVQVDRDIDICSRRIKEQAPLMAMESIFIKKMGILNADQNRVDEVMRLTRESYHQCMEGSSQLTMAQLGTRANDCTNRTAIAFARHLGRSTLDFMAPIRQGNENIMGQYNACLDEVNRQRERGMDFIKRELDLCATRELKPRLIREIHLHYNSKIAGPLTGGERGVVEDAFTMLAPFFQDKVTTSGTGGNPVDILDQTFGQLIKFITPAARFDQVETQRRITAFKVHIRGLTASGPITQTRFTEELVKSPLMDIIIEAQIASAVIALADGAWLGDTARDHVVNPERMRNLFERDPDGIAIMQAIKREVVGPMLAGVPMNTILSDIERKVRAEVNRQIDNIKRELRSMLP